MLIFATELSPSMNTMPPVDYGGWVDWWRAQAYQI